jgi:hypothetical protein
MHHANVAQNEVGRLLALAAELVDPQVAGTHILRERRILRLAGETHLAGETQRILFSRGTLLLLPLLPSSISPGIIASTTGQFSAIALPGP